MVSVVVVAFFSQAMIGGGGGGEGYKSFPACALNFFFFLLKLRSSRGHHIRSLGQNQSTVAQRANRGQTFPGELRVSSFP